MTEREIEILRMVATGVTNRYIAYRLGISTNTVKVHLRNIFTKLGAESRTEATMIAVREGWVTVGDGAAAGAVLPTPAIAPVPPLSWPRRIALIAALALVVTTVAVTWPQGKPQTAVTEALPLPLPGRSGAPGTESEDSRWRERAQMPTRRAYLALAAVEGRLFAIAGQTPEGTSVGVEIYDPQSDHWTRGSDKPTPAIYVTAAVIGTDVYVPGGCDAAGVPVQTVEVYDTRADSWRQAAPLPQPRCAYALAEWQGKIYLFGGWDGARYTADVYIYDPRSDAWSTGVPMPAARGFAAAAALNNRLYVVGGYDGERELAVCTVYEPEEDAWATCAPLAIGRGGLGLVTVGGQLYAVGGGGWTSYLGFGERYNPSDDAWSPVETPLVGEWRSPGVTVLEGTIYAIGGWSEDYLSLNQAYEPFPFRIFIPVSGRQ